MRPTIAAVFLTFFLAVSTVAEEANAPRADDVTNKQLLKRIEQLEKRIAALESRPRGPYVPLQPYVPGKPNPQVTPTPDYPSNYPPHLPPRAPQHGPYFPSPPKGYTEPPVQPDKRVPDSWQRFEFNGQYFYIIPVDEFERTRSRHR
jgi:hypothetical protein